MATFNFDDKARTPWNNIIYPGNYVSRLNAYRDQGVNAIPGVEFFRSVGAIVLNPDISNVTNNGVLETGTYTPIILSPDMRRDDQPRKDRKQVIPAGAVVYRTAVSAPGVRTETVAAGKKIEIAVPASKPAPVPMLSDAEGYFNPVGEFSLFEAILDYTAPLVETTVTAKCDANLIASLKPSAGACRKSPSAIIVEVCYYMQAPAPSSDELPLPYAVESGSDSN